MTETNRKALYFAGGFFFLTTLLWYWAWSNVFDGDVFSGFFLFLVAVVPTYLYTYYIRKALFVDD